jgi:hypothetical protein
MKAWIDLSIQREISARAVWLMLGSGSALLLLLRFSPLSVNFLYYDDFTLLPVHHLEHHRFVQAAEQAFWFWIYGPTYPRSFIPKLVSIVYILIGVWAMGQIFRAWKVPLVTSFIAVFIFLSHPILTDYLVWNTLSSANLAWAFVLLGYWAQLRTGRYTLAIGVALGFLGLGTYQIVIGLPAMLVLAEATLRLASNGEGIPWKRRLVWVALPIFLYGLYLLVSDGLWAYSISQGTSSGVRGLPSLSEMFIPSFIRQRYDQSSHGYFNVFQPLLSYYFGGAAAWRGGWIAWAVIALSVPISLSIARVPGRVLIACSTMFLCALLMPMVFHWFVSHSSSGWRVAIGMLLAFCLWFVVLSMILLKHKQLDIVAFGNLIAVIFLISLVPVTITDAENRAEGFKVTKNLIEFFRVQATSTTTDITATSVNLKPESLQRKIRSGSIVMSFQNMSCKDYALAGYQDVLQPLLASLRVKLVSVDLLPAEVRSRLNALCEQGREHQRCGILGVTEPASRLVGACFY